MKRRPGSLSGFRAVAVLLGVFIAACLPTRQAGSGTESGNVVGSIYTADNQPAAGIMVTLIPVNPDSATIIAAVTDADGEYVFQDVLGAYSLFALDGAGNGLKLDSILADTANPIDLDRHLLSPLASVTGYAKVIGVRKNVEVEPKVEMGLSGSPYRTETAPNTKFLWSDLPAGRYKLAFSYGLAEPVTMAVTLEPGQTLDLDTVTLINQYFNGFSPHDTLTITSSQLPLRFEDKLLTDISDLDSVLWGLNGETINFRRVDRYMTFVLEPGMLRDTGYNVIELRLYFPDTTVFYDWHIDFESSPMLPWAYHAVKGIVIGVESNLLPNRQDVQIGSFRILERRLLSEAELAIWNFSPKPDGDTALPDSIKIPINRHTSGGPCDEWFYVPEVDITYGDTVTFLTEPNEFWGGTVFRIRKHEDYSGFDKLAWFDKASWPLAGSYADNAGTFDLSIDAEALIVRMNLRLPMRPEHRVAACQPLLRGFKLGANGIPDEYVAMPDGMSSGNLLLHFRAGLPNGLHSEVLAASGEYVFLDSAGSGIAGSGADRREVKLSASQVAELKALLAPLPAAIPLEWIEDYIEDKSTKEPPDYYSLLLKMNYLLSGGRGCLLAGEPRSRPVTEAKLKLFQEVEAWLRSHDLLQAQVPIGD